jgi:hypothetical protein
VIAQDIDNPAGLESSIQSNRPVNVVCDDAKVQKVILYAD